MLLQIKFLEQLNALLEGLTSEEIQKCCPDEPAQSDDVVVGTLPPALQGFYVLHKKLAGEIDESGDLGSMITNKVMTEVFSGVFPGLLSPQGRSTDLIERLFEEMVRTEFPTIENALFFEVRAEWKVVAFHVPEPSFSTSVVHMSSTMMVQIPFASSQIGENVLSNGVRVCDDPNTPPDGILATGD